MKINLYEAFIKIIVIYIGILFINSLSGESVFMTIVYGIAFFALAVVDTATEDDIK